MAFENSKWIWYSDADRPDEYAEFFTKFEAEGDALCRISVEGDYTLFINGKFVASNQYGDYEHYKVYDEIDISNYVKAGENTFACLVWRIGVSSSRCLPARSGLIYEIVSDGKVVSASSPSVRSRRSRAYKNEYVKMITQQLGQSFLYDANLDDNWINEGGKDFFPSVETDKKAELFARPITKLALLDKKAGLLVNSTDGKNFVFDLGEESVGLCALAFRSATAQKITVAWGEYLVDGHVRRKIHARDFSFEYVCREGANEYVNYMLRLGCRYIEVSAEEPIDNVKVDLIPQVYPTKRREVTLADETDQKIYDVCVKTLELCMLEHYVDCPWREQCLYSLDSRNQMFFGYYAFEDKNAAYVRSNLLLMSKDRRDDNLLAICYPCGVDLTIPSYSLYYVIAVADYTEFTGDVTLAREVDFKLREILDCFKRNLKNSLVHKLEGENHWNFYDWSEHSDGTLGRAEESVPDAAINILMYAALNAYERICKSAGLTFGYEGVADEIAAATNATFFDENKGAYTMSVGKDEYTELINSLAVWCGLADGKKAQGICSLMAKGELKSASLGMKLFKYDAYMMTDKEKYRELILSEIHRDYTYMLNEGATSFWETLLGAADFDGAGSLCHGWASIPVYVFDKLL